MYASPKAILSVAIYLTTLFTSTTALPVNTQSCKAVQNPNVLDALFSDLLHVTWGVDVGVPFKDGNGCSAIEDALRAAVGSGFANFQCMNDANVKTGGGGGTLIMFDGIFNDGIGQKINAALTSVFPPIMGGFNCPDS